MEEIVQKMYKWEWEGLTFMLNSITSSSRQVFFGDQEASKITVLFIHNYRCNKVGQDDFLPVMKQVLEVLCTKPEKVRWRCSIAMDNNKKSGGEVSLFKLIFNI